MPLGSTHIFISQYLLSTYSMPGPDLGTGVASVNRRGD